MGNSPENALPIPVYRGVAIGLGGESRLTLPPGGNCQRVRNEPLTEEECGQKNCGFGGFSDFITGN